MVSNHAAPKECTAPEGRRGKEEWEDGGPGVGEGKVMRDAKQLAEPET